LSIGKGAICTIFQHRVYYGSSGEWIYSAANNRFGGTVNLFAGFFLRKNQMMIGVACFLQKELRQKMQQIRPVGYN